LGPIPEVYFWEAHDKFTFEDLAYPRVPPEKNGQILNKKKSKILLVAV